MLDVAVAFSRYRFLGPEFLTWLWYAIEREPDVIKAAAMSRGSLTVGNRIVLENRLDQPAERVTISGENADLGEGMLALKKGALVPMHSHESEQMTYVLQGALKFQIGAPQKVRACTRQPRLAS